MSKYQITLTPVDNFFFGGDMTFQVGENKKEEFNERFSSYIIKSSMFPQQTSLLGMLRFLILRNGGDAVFKGGRIVNNELAKELIGNGSFSVNGDQQANRFGTIQSLSHVWIRKTSGGREEDLEFEPFFRALEFTDESGVYNKQTVSIPDMPIGQYDPKESFSSKLTGGKELADIFIEDRRIGIARDIQTGKTGEKGEHALFKQVSYRFANKETVTDKQGNEEAVDVQYCFVFQAEIDDAVPFENYNGQLVKVGGDNSQFVIGISKTERSQVDVSNEGALYLSLLSPTYLSRDEMEDVKFAITRLVPFRFLKAEVDKVKSYNITRKEKDTGVKRSEKYELYAPGSVFYFDNEAQRQRFISHLEAKKDFRQIGYNEYK